MAHDIGAILKSRALTEIAPLDLSIYSIYLLQFPQILSDRMPLAFSYYYSTHYKMAMTPRPRWRYGPRLVYEKELHRETILTLYRKMGNGSPDHPLIPLIVIQGWD